MDSSHTGEREIMRKDKFLEEQICKSNLKMIKVIKI